MCDPADETTEPRVTRLIGAMLTERRPSGFEVPGEAEFLPLPGRKRLTRRIAQM
jgi:hypothetical protein